MISSRWATLALAAGLLANGGCCFCWPERPWFGRRCCGNGNGCCSVSNGEMVSSEGPILMDGGPQGTILGQPPGTAEPQMAPMPRFVPVPAQPSPYSPMKRTSGVAGDVD